MKPTAIPADAPRSTQWLVIVDHRDARIYRSVAAGAIPQQIRPHVAEEPFRPGAHAEDLPRGHEKADVKSYFEPVAGVLNGAGQILIFGTGIGQSSEMDQFVNWLQATRPGVAGRVIGAQVVDANHLSEEQLLAKARGIYATGRGV